MYTTTLSLLFSFSLLLPVSRLLHRLYGPLASGAHLTGCMLAYLLLPLGSVVAVIATAGVGLHAYREEQRRMLGELPLKGPRRSSPSAFFAPLPLGAAEGIQRE
ncbi:MAG TPA: hypothetical protein DFR83_06575 [Deltaproteobacteria bacterium]|nr:hypothetical protein [Deltaproteobacteria bacterium]